MTGTTGWPDSALLQGTAGGCISASGVYIQYTLEFTEYTDTRVYTAEYAEYTDIQKCRNAEMQTVQGKNLCYSPQLYLHAHAVPILCIQNHQHLTSESKPVTERNHPRNKRKRHQKKKKRKEKNYVAGCVPVISTDRVSNSLGKRHSR